MSRANTAMGGRDREDRERVFAAAAAEGDRRHGGECGMSDVFISYAREDRAAAARVAGVLVRAGWAVWWDPEIPPGDVWDARIERELASVPCVVVLWSATSVNKRWVRAEAAAAVERGVLVPALIEAVAPPLAFRDIQAADLTAWCGDAEHAGFRQLVASIEGLVESAGRRGAEPGRGQRQRAATAVRSILEQQPLPAGTARPAVLRLAATAPPSRPRWQVAPLQRVGRTAALLALGGALGYAINDTLQGPARNPVPAGIAESGSVAPAAGNPAIGCAVIGPGDDAAARASGRGPAD